VKSDSLQREALIEHLLLQNAIEFAGIDETTGDILYNIKPKLREVKPSMYYDMKRRYEEDLYSQIEAGPESVPWNLRLK
jgi:hypothetical protein